MGERSPGLSRGFIIALVVLFGVVLLGAGAFGAWRWSVHRQEARTRHPAQDPPSPAQARAARQEAVVVVSPAPLPTALPLKGPEGRDADGYPLRYVDRPALRSLLHHRRFAELTKYIEELQTEFEADPRKEYWPVDAGLAFESSEPELAAALDAWVAATPTSFAPWFARGNHWSAVGWVRRGAKYANETDPGDLRAMSEAFDKAERDLEKAVVMRPKLVAALRQMLRSDNANGVAGDRPLQRSLAACPDCFLTRASHMFRLMPRWGGSHEAMLAFARSSPVAKNPRLRLLAGYVDFDRAVIASSDKKHADALEAIDRACALGDHWEFLTERSRIRRHLDKDVPLALADVNRADALRPSYPKVLFERAQVERKLGHWEGAGRDLFAGLRLDPTDDDSRVTRAHVVENLITQGTTYTAQGQRDDALRVLELAQELAPGYPKLNRAHEQAVVAGLKPTDDIATLEKRAAASPDDFRIRQQLDYVLVKRRDHTRIAAMWTEYLERHPEDGRAYLERGGTWGNLGDNPESLADFTKACDLGMSAGCGFVRSMTPR